MFCTESMWKGRASRKSFLKEWFFCNPARNHPSSRFLTIFRSVESWQYRLLQLVNPSISKEEKDLWNCPWWFSFLCWRPGKSVVTSGNSVEFLKPMKWHKQKLSVLCWLGFFMYTLRGTDEHIINHTLEMYLYNHLGFFPFVLKLKAFKEKIYGKWDWKKQLALSGFIFLRVSFRLFSS